MTPRVRLAIDAANLAHDRRGIGRIVRGVLATAREDSRFEPALLADKAPDVRALREEFTWLDVRPAKTARPANAYDAVWFPFNGMRFSVGPPSLVGIADAFAFTEPHRERVARFREQAPIRRAAREASRIVTISAWSRAEIARELALAPEDIEIVAPAPSAFWCPGSGDKLPAPLVTRRYALVVGAREPRKNIRLALETAARALRDGEFLAIVGDLSPADRAFARTRGVRAGEIAATDETLRGLYRQAGAVLVPSTAEGFGLVAVEAMACGAPVLASNAAALPEATGGAARLLDPHDPNAWAAALRELFDDKTLATSMGARAAARFSAADRQAPARRILALLEQLGRGANAG